MLRHRLHFGPYRTPRFRIGQRVEDERRGTVKVVALSDGRIMWPIGTGGRSLVLYGALARAVRRESSLAVQYWWGVTGRIVTKWRRALGVPRMNEGDRRLRSAIGKRNKNAIRAMHATAQDPERRAKIAAAQRGKRRPPHVVEAMRKANLGRKPSFETRARMSASAKLRAQRDGTYPPAAGRPFSEFDNVLIRTLPPKLAAKRTRRTLDAVYCRRSDLGVADGRTRAGRHLLTLCAEG